MNSREFKINSRSGLGSFSRLEKEFGVANYITYDSRIWGNLNPSFARSEKEKKEIEAKNRKLADLLGSQFIAAIATPPEGTIIDFDQNTFDYLNFVSEEEVGGYKFAWVKANAVILTVPRVALIFKPRDCAIMMFVRKDWDGVICLHLGAPTAVQNLHNKTLLHFKGLFDTINIADFEVYTTPNICPKHYKIKKEKYDAFIQTMPAIETFLSSTKETGQYHFDFMGFVKHDLERKWGITRFYETGICTYEAARAGNLFSYTLSKEDEESFPHGCFNVAVSLK